MPDEEIMLDRSWRRKFHCAFRGLKRGMRGESSFFVHVFAAAAVVVAAGAFDADRYEWCLLGLCITTVFTAEMFNSSIEHLAKAVDRNFNPHLRDALDIAGGAVLLASLGAAALGLAILGRLASTALGW
ncbi:MAG: diacylglycerol kinase [Planctomycetia bacterium]|nr:diacylglycerol kinase [Planctomycetia bacterium]